MAVWLCDCSLWEHISSRTAFSCSRFNAFVGTTKLKTIHLPANGKDEFGRVWTGFPWKSITIKEINFYFCNIFIFFFVIYMRDKICPVRPEKREGNIYDEKSNDRNGFYDVRFCAV